MKVRNCFVSNSSTSMFLLLNKLTPEVKELLSRYPRRYTDDCIRIDKLFMLIGCLDIEYVYNDVLNSNNPTLFDEIHNGYIAENLPTIEDFANELNDIVTHYTDERLYIGGRDLAYNSLLVECVIANYDKGYDEVFKKVCDILNKSIYAECVKWLEKLDALIRTDAFKYLDGKGVIYVNNSYHYDFVAEVENLKDKDSVIYIGDY